MCAKSKKINPKSPKIMPVPFLTLKDSGPLSLQIL